MNKAEWHEGRHGHLLREEGPFLLSVQRSSSSSAWEYQIRPLRSSNVISAGVTSTEAGAKSAATRTARHMASQRRTLRVGDWHAKWAPERPSSIDLDYEGKAYKRSQSLVRYDHGGLGYDFPEVVPTKVRAKVEAWSRKLPKKR